MKKSLLLSVLLCGLLASGATAGLFGDWGDHDQQVAVQDLPANVVKTVERVFPQGVIQSAESEKEDGNVMFDVKVRVEETLYSVEATSEGKLTKVEMEEDED